MLLLSNIVTWNLAFTTYYFELHCAYIKVINSLLDQTTSINGTETRVFDTLQRVLDTKNCFVGDKNINLSDNIFTSPHKMEQLGLSERHRVG